MTLGALGLASVLAADPTLAISPIEYSGDIPDHVEDDVDAAVLEALAQLSIEPLDARELGCRALACTLRKARDADLAHVVLVRVEAEERDFQIVVEARAASNGRVEFRNEELCELCGHHELLAVVTAQVRTIAGLLERGSGAPTLQVHGSPSDATVMLDGKPLGSAPLELEVEAGSHRVELRAPGYTSQSYRWQASAGIEEVIDYELSPPRVNGRRAKIGGWVGFALGVAGLGVGGALLAIDGREHGPTCATDLRDVRGACPNVYATQVAGIVTAGVGGAALLTGTSLLIYGARKSGQQDRPVAAIEASAGGWALRF